MLWSSSEAINAAAAQLAQEREKLCRDRIRFMM
jgi:hypothetical protein